jgi:intracellular multiplication protein IcmC
MLKAERPFNVSVLIRYVWLFFPLKAFADVSYDQISLETLVKNLATQLPQVWLFFTATAYVFGFFFVFYGLLQLKKHAEQRSMMSQEASLKGPLLYIFIGAAFIYLPTTLNAGLTTFWLNPNPYGYEDEVSNEWADLYKACIVIVQLVGLIAFMRGLIIFTHMGQGGQQGQFGRGLAHIIGGIFLIDIFDVLRMIFATFGLPSIIPS